MAMLTSLKSCSLTAVVIRKTYYRTSLDREAGNQCKVKLAFSKVIPVVCLYSSPLMG